jgi:hypothetical protein
MKLSELFEAPLDKLSSGAYRAPGYDANRKSLVGSVKDWLKLGDITDEDVKKAMTRVKGTPLFRNDLSKAGLIYTPSEGMEKRGTLNFKVNYPTALIFKDGRVKKTFFNNTYQVHANGQIRSSSEFDTYHTKLVSPKPRMIPGDKVGSLVKTYTAALEELLSKWKKSRERMDKAVEKADKMIAAKLKEK